MFGSYEGLSLEERCTLMWGDFWYNGQESAWYPYQELDLGSRRPQFKTSYSK